MTEAHTFTGSCLCGTIRYRATAAPLRGVICHCELPRFGRSSTAVPSQA
jgi:hypothetical protein